MGLANYMEKHDALFRLFLINDALELVHCENARTQTLKIYRLYGREIGMDYVFTLMSELQKRSKLVVGKDSKLPSFKEVFEKFNLDIHHEVLEILKLRYPKKKESTGPTMGQVEQKLAAEKKKILEEAHKMAKGGGKTRPPMRARTPPRRRSRTPPPRGGKEKGNKDSRSGGRDGGDPLPARRLQAPAIQF